MPLTQTAYSTMVYRQPVKATVPVNSGQEAFDKSVDDLPVGKEKKRISTCHVFMA